MDAGTGERERLAAMRPRLQARTRTLACIREFLAGQGFLEIDTPIRIPTPALEDYIDAEPAGSRWLRTSPELHMKRLLAAGYDRIFQLGPCFRAGERGRRHLPEFTMLEWYRAGTDSRAILEDTVGLLRATAQAVGDGNACTFRGERIDIGGDWEELTMDEAFRRYCGITPEEALSAGAFEARLVTDIEPRLGRGRPTVLTEWPAACSGLSRSLPGRPDRADRWELYIGGLELANACGELTDAAEQRRRFEACAELRATEGRDVYPVDEAFLGALEAGMPDAAGIAIGVDRLVMVLTDAPAIDDVVAFPGC